jgi:hypothetical protein
VFNIDTGLLWKHDLTEVKMASGLKAPKGSCAKIFGGKAPRDCKLLPLMMYHLHNLWQFEGYVKTRWSVVWQSNEKRFLRPF